MTLRSTAGVLEAVSSTPPTFTAATTTTPMTAVLAMAAWDCRRRPASAMSGMTAKPAAMSVSHSK